MANTVFLSDEYSFGSVDLGAANLAAERLDYEDGFYYDADPYETDPYAGFGSSDYDLYDLDRDCD